MSDFKELVKRFEKIRSYVRDFYIYGFKTREDFTDKSARTYDNERRRIESWFSGYVRQEYHAGHKKSVFITLDSNRIASNPLYHAWKTKSFTANDIMLHFFLMDLLADRIPRNVDAITDEIQNHYQVLFDSQTVRRKLAAYVREGLVTVLPEGRRHLYQLAGDLRQDAPDLLPGLLDAVCFFQAAAPFGFVGSTILDFCHAVNERFRFRHDFLVHTLEDEILLPLLDAIRDRYLVTLTVRSSRDRSVRRPQGGAGQPVRSGTVRQITGTPLKILVSTQTGRRYVCMHKQSSRRLVSYRLDAIQAVERLEPDQDFQTHMEDFLRNVPAAFGVSFGSRREPDQVRLRVTLDEVTEPHIIQRLEREGRGGTVTRIEPGIYEYTTSCWDAMELVPWARTFTGRILAFTCSRREVEVQFWADMKKMGTLYKTKEPL